MSSPDSSCESDLYHNTILIRGMRANIFTNKRTVRIAAIAAVVAALPMALGALGFADIQSAYAVDDNNCTGGTGGAAGAFGTGGAGGLAACVQVHQGSGNDAIGTINISDLFD